MTRLTACAGCGRLVAPGPRCYDCRQTQARTYDRTRPEHHRLYQSPEWRRLSAEVRASATRCHWCLKPTRRLVADHVRPVGPDTTMSEFLDRDGLRPACIPCNTRRGRNARLPDLSEPAGALAVQPLSGVPRSASPAAGRSPSAGIPSNPSQ